MLRNIPDKSKKHRKPGCRWLPLALLGLVFAIGGFALPHAAEAAKNVYYSVGQSSSNLMTGSPTMTISGGVATFSTPQTGNIGVGDQIAYNNSATSVYISGKQTTSKWTVITVTGDAPPNISEATTVNAVSRAFTSLNSAESGAADASHLNTLNLVGGDYILNLPCYYDTGPDPTAVTIGGWTTGVNNYINIYTPTDTATEANQSQRHKGTWTTAAWRLEGAADYVDFLTVSNAYTRLTGLQVKRASGGGSRATLHIKCLKRPRGPDDSYRECQHVVRRLLDRYRGRHRR